jgi:hypothetical protein
MKGWAVVQLTDGISQALLQGKVFTPFNEGKRYCGSKGRILGGGPQ